MKIIITSILMFMVGFSTDGWAAKLTAVQAAKKCFGIMSRGMQNQLKMEGGPVNGARLVITPPIPLTTLRDSDLKQISSAGPGALLPLSKHTGNYESWIFLKDRFVFALNFTLSDKFTCSAWKIGKYGRYSNTQWAATLSSNPWIAKEPLQLFNYDGILFVFLQHGGKSYLTVIEKPPYGPASSSVSGAALTEFPDGLRFLQNWREKKEALSKSPQCKKVGQEPIPSGPGYNTIPQCCAGLVQRKSIDYCGKPVGGDVDVCLACGDGICDPKLENKCNCPEDCK